MEGEPSYIGLFIFVGLGLGLMVLIASLFIGHKNEAPKAGNAPRFTSRRSARKPQRNPPTISDNTPVPLGSLLPSAVEINLGQGENYYKNGNFEAALVSFENARQESPFDKVVLDGLARTHLALKNFQA